MKYERQATGLDLFGRASRYLFARHKTTGHRISARKFYGLKGTGDFEREGYVLKTSAAGTGKANLTPRLL